MMRLELPNELLKVVTIENLLIFLVLLIVVTVVKRFFNGLTDMTIEGIKRIMFERKRNGKTVGIEENEVVEKIEQQKNGEKVKKERRELLIFLILTIVLYIILILIVPTQLVNISSYRGMLLVNILYKVGGGLIVALVVSFIILGITLRTTAAIFYGIDSGIERKKKENNFNRFVKDLSKVIIFYIGIMMLVESKYYGDMYEEKKEMGKIEYKKSETVPSK